MHPCTARLLWALARDPRVPTTRKALLGFAGAYIIAPIDLIPERIPLIGALDDVAVMVLAIDVFLEGLPENLLKEKLDELGIPQAELDSDLRRVRRILPRPVRAVIARRSRLPRSSRRYRCAVDLWKSATRAM